jgi:integrase
LASKIRKGVSKVHQDDLRNRFKLTWKDVDLRGGFITVRKKNSKTASRRTIKMEPNLLAWLLPYAGQTGRIFSGDIYRLVFLLRTWLGWSAEKMFFVKHSRAFIFWPARNIIPMAEVA